MTHMNKRLIGSGVAMLVALAAAGTTVGAGMASNGTASDGPLSCAIETSRSGGAIAIESTATSTRAASGSYSFSVRGGGTDIRQGGEFEADAGETVALGTIMLDGGSYDLKLEVSSGGRSASCSQRIG